ncbi:hypothetical protein RJ641_020521 [Dillenia turbinata]|uniref:Uncharacterized protein n=1 Tax=Dillenia turbinata TaxID=194707 RepID=A0AAN8YU72_9MAGN
MLLTKANIHKHSQTILTINCRALPQGSPSKYSQWPRLNPGQRGGLEIVFNQQLTRLSYYLTSCVIAPSAKIPYASKVKGTKFLVPSRDAFRNCLGAKEGSSLSNWDKIKL